MVSRFWNRVKIAITKTAKIKSKKPVARNKARSHFVPSHEIFDAAARAAAREVIFSQECKKLRVNPNAAYRQILDYFEKNDIPIPGELERGLAMEREFNRPIAFLESNGSFIEIRLRSYRKGDFSLSQTSIRHSSKVFEKDYTYASNPIIDVKGKNVRIIMAHPSERKIAKLEAISRAVLFGEMLKRGKKEVLEALGK